MAGAVTVVDEVQGFRYFDNRDLLGFVEGTENYTKNGKKISVPYAAVVEFKGDKIVAWRDYFADPALQAMIRRGKLDVPEDKSSRLVLVVSHEMNGAWNLIVRAGGRALHESLIGGDETPQWRIVSIDLSQYAGRSVDIELQQGSAGDKPDAAYWAQIEVISE